MAERQPQILSGLSCCGFEGGRRFLSEMKIIEIDMILVEC